MTRRARRLLSIAALACGLAALLFVANRILTASRPNPLIPPRPDISSWPAQFGEALGRAESHVRRDDDPAAGLERLGELYRGNGFYEQASACYRHLMELQPAQAKWPHVLANILAGFGRLDEALPLQQHAAQLAPANFLCQLRLGDMQLKSDHPDLAAAAYETALKLEADNPYALLGLVRCDLAAGRWNDARMHLLASIKRQPRFPGTWDLLATVHDHFGEKAGAEGARKAAAVIGAYRDIQDPWLQSDDDDCFDAYQLSVAAARTSDPAEAQRQLERAVAFAPRNSAIRRQLAKLLEKKGDLKAARVHLQAAVEASPTDADSWAALIENLTAVNDLPAMQEALARALALCPQSAYLHFADGLRLTKLNRLDEAGAAFQASVRLQPNEARAHVQLSAIYVRQARLPEALAEIRAARAAEPGNAGVLVLLAGLEIATNDEAGARRTIQQLRESPQTPPEDLAATVQVFRQEFGHEPF